MFQASRIKKWMAAAMSGVLLATLSVGAFPLTSSAEPVNLISNGTFDNGIADWGMYKESGGAATLIGKNKQLALNITNVGKLNYSVQAFYDIIPLYQNGVYHLSYEISSSINRAAEGMIQQNGGTYQAYTWKGLDLTPEPLKVDYTFTMEEETDIMAKLVFNCGTPGTDLPEHTIYLDNVVLELVDDSKVDYGASKPYSSPILTNQIGYKPDSEKIAVFRAITDESQFSVIDAATEKVVYTGAITGPKTNASAKETNYFGDFSAVTTPGKYYIKCGSKDISYSFTIGENVYDTLLDDTVRMMYLQRCGTEIKDAAFGHVACHTTKAKVYGTNDYIDVSGGWHDAGDYGRYVVPAAKTVADLLNAYAANPTMFSDQVNIPESGNGIPDVLDEAKYALTWMLKMQASNGGVYHKVTCENFPGYVMPQEEKGELIVTPVSTTATADFCAAMAMASEFYASVDSTFAATCLAAAERAWAFLEQNPNMIFKNPADISTGAYNDTVDKDERYWAAAQMFRATKNDKYLTALNSMAVKTGMDWSTVGDYGSIALLTMENADTTASYYTKAKEALLSQADDFVAITKANAYGESINEYNWGSNMTVANAGVLLGLASKLTNDSKYALAASDNLHYLLGRNPNGTCYVTGYGTVTPLAPHHRPSMAVGSAMKGMLVGGVNSNLEDSAAKAYLKNEPAAKCYIDNSESYSTNEVTTYWNSPLIYLLTVIDTPKAQEVLAGDVNLDGKVNVADAVLLQQFLLNNTTLTAEQGTNADLCKDGKLNALDLTMLKRKLLGF